MLQWARWIIAAVAFAGAGVLSTPDTDSVDADIMRQAAVGILDEGTPVVSVTAANVPEGSYSQYGLGMTLLMVPPLAAERALGLQTLRLVALVNPLLLAVIALAVFDLARVLGATHKRAAIVTSALAFGTFLFTYGTTYYSEPAVATCVAVALVSLARKRAGWVIGAVAGAAVLLRVDSLVLVGLPLALAYLATRPPTRQLAYAALAASPSLALTAWWNHARYGSPFKQGYTGGFPHPFADGVTGLTISPGKGLLFYAPVVAVALVGVVAAYKRWPLLTTTAVVLVLARLAFYAKWWAWEGGLSFGPRFLIPAMPALAVPLAAIVQRRWAPRAITVTAVAGGLVAVLGAVSFGTWGEEDPPSDWRAHPVAIFLRHHT